MGTAAFSPSGGHVGEPQGLPQRSRLWTQSSPSGSLRTLGKARVFAKRGSLQHVHTPWAWPWLGLRRLCIGGPGWETARGSYLFHLARCTTEPWP